MKNIVLIGMPGSGKSTTGVVLAKVLGCKFIDCDLVIQEKTDKKLFELIAEYGCDGFLQIEDKINSEIIARKSVIATGGSAVFGENAMKNFSENGIIVYLRLSLDEIKNRVGDLNRRGVVMRNATNLEECYNERIPLYEKYSDITIDCNDTSIRETVEKIIMEIDKYDRKK